MSIVKKVLQNAIYYVSDFVVKVAESDLARRAFHTFWQTALVAWTLSNFSLDIGVLAGVAGASLSAAKGILVEAIKEYRS